MWYLAQSVIVPTVCPSSLLLPSHHLQGDSSAHGMLQLASRATHTLVHGQIRCTVQEPLELDLYLKSQTLTGVTGPMSPRVAQNSHKLGTYTPECDSMSPAQRDTQQHSQPHAASGTQLQGVRCYSCPPPIIQTARRAVTTL